MERIIKKTFIYFSVLIFISNNCYAQNENKQPLLQVLNTLEIQYNIQFNYAEDSIKNVFVELPSQDYTLEEVLNDLRSKTNLSFTLISNNIVLIKQEDGTLICGYIKDKDTGAPLVSATIQHSENSVITDESGFFQLKISDISASISIRYLGYKSITMLYNQFSKQNCKTILMQLDFQPLSEVVISNYITSGINKINNGSYEIDFTNFDILPGLIDNDVLQSVQAFPGIQSVNETVSNINIRGGTHDQNLILWDGIKMYQSGHFFGLIPCIIHKLHKKFPCEKMEVM